MKNLDSTKPCSVDGANPIDLKEARTYIDDHIALKEILQNVVIPSYSNPSGITEKAVNIFKSDTNAFVFCSDLIKGLIEKGADEIVVFYGAAEENKAIKPTVVLLGAKKNNDTLTSLDMDKPAIQHPPSKVSYRVPESRDKNFSNEYIEIVIE